MKHIKVVFPLFIILTASIPSDFTEEISRTLEQYVRNYPQEKVYIHFDRDEYYSGEDVWFKVYLVNGLTHQRDSLSFVAYVDFIDEKSKLVQQKRIKISGGVGNGSFTLPRTQKFQIITVKAYTSWMRNFTADYFFEKKLKVYSSKEVKPGPEVNSYNFQLLPESGYLVSGVANQLGFKATDRFGHGIDFSGKILEGGQAILEFHSSYKGMGKVEFNPVSGREYFYEVTFPDGTKGEGKIEGIQNDYGLQVDNSKVDFLNLHILVSPNQKNPDETTWLVLQSQGRIFFAAQVKLSKPDIEIPVAKFTLPHGIVQCMLFDENGLPKAERLAFIHKPIEHKLEISTSKPVYEPREETIVNLNLSNDSMLVRGGEFSLSVIDIGQVNPSGEFESHINDYLLLSSEIPGRIENPGYYFDESNTQRKEHLDLLLMTQGWRRFRWSKILNEAPPQYSFFMERGFTIEGELTNLRGKALSDGSISMFMYGDKGGLLTTPVNEIGEFAFYDLDITDSTQIFLQGKTGRGKDNVKMNLDTLETRPDFFMKEYSPAAITENSKLEDLGLDRIKIMEAFNLSGMDKVLEEVVIKGNRPKPLYERKHNQYYPAPNKRLNTADFPNLDAYVNVFHFLRGRVPGMQISGNYYDPIISSRGSGANGTVSIQNNQALLILVDGVPWPIDVVTSIPMHRIETIDIINNVWASALYGGQGGMVAIYLKEGTSFDYYVPKGTSNFTMKGYSINKEFYKTDYSDSSDLAIPDYRATLHWEPYIQFDSLGRASVSFFNSDLETEILIQVEGLTDSGEPLSVSHTYEIKK